MHYRSASSKNRQRGGLWIFDEGDPLPEGVVMHRNTHPSIYTGELAEKVKSELRRRLLMSGGRRPQNTAAFSGLLVCRECGYYLILDRSVRSTYRGWRCDSRYFHTAPRKDCPSRKQINEKKVQQWFHDALVTMLASSDPEIYFAAHEDETQPQRLEAIHAKLSKTTVEMRRVMGAIKLVDEDEPGFRDLAMEYEDLGRQRQSLEFEQAQVERESASIEKQERRQAFEALVEVGLPAFWELPSFRINQLLVRLFGRWKAEMRDGVILGLVAVDRRKLPRLP